MNIIFRVGGVNYKRGGTHLAQMFIDSYFVTLRIRIIDNDYCCVLSVQP